MKKIVLCFAFIATLLTACKEDEIMTYSDLGGLNGLFFQHTSREEYATAGMSVLLSRTYVDSLGVNFSSSKSDVTSTLARFPVKLIGHVVDYDRKINFKVNKELTTGIEGIDFEINYDTTYLKANRNSASINIKVLRTLKIRTERVVVALDLLESDDLKLLMNTYLSSTVWNSTSNKTFPANTFKFSIIEQASKPPKWDAGYFGDWTLDKYNELNGLMEWDAVMWDGVNNPSSGSPISSGIFPYAAYHFKMYLQEKADAGTPIKETDGSLMQLPGIYAVDYSNYE